MKLNRLAFISFIALLFGAGSVSAQMVGTDAFFMTTTLEIGYHTRGYEGSSVLPPFPTHYRGGTGSLGFLANPLEDGWVNYNGDFYLPGYPANSHAIEYGGTNYKNAYPGSYGIPSSGLSGYAEIGRCLIVDWDGSVAGIDVHINYRTDTTTSYYIVDVTLTNTTSSDMTDVYYYKTFDPDNNQDISWGFSTFNTIHAQPTPFCPKSLITAEDDEAWDSFVGLGAVDPDTRVARGGGLDPGDGSDIYDGVGGLIGAIGSATADQAIAICHKDAVLAAGESSNFQFVVILSEEQVEEAILSLYFVDYDGSDGALASCTAEYIDVDGDGDEDPVPDTLHADCASGPITLSLEGPYLGLGYDIVWTIVETGEIVGTDASIEVDPADTTLYRVVASPDGACFELDIERFVIVAVSGLAPVIVITDLGLQCADVPISDLIITDSESIPGTLIEYYSTEPDGIGDVTDIWPGDPIGPDDEIWIMMWDPIGLCYDIEQIIIEFVEISAGLDSLGLLMCNSGPETVDLNTMIIDSILVDAAAYWYESSTVLSGSFDAITAIFDPTGVDAGDYVFDYVADGGGVCENDTASMFITVYDQPTSGIDDVGEICNEIGFVFDVNTLLSGHDGGGFWEETISTSGAFDETTGILTINGVTPTGDYNFEYITLGTDPCINDTARFLITINPLPIVDAGADQSICDGDETVLSAFGDAATYVWDPATIIDGVPFTPPVDTVTYTVTATDANGCVSTDDMVIIVHALPTIHFSAPDLDGCTPFEVDFTIYSDFSNIDHTDWTFGDGDVSLGYTSAAISHTYIYGGTYDVEATVTDEFGCISSIEYPGYIYVEDFPIAKFTMSPQSVYVTDTEVEFTNESLYATNYLWDFGDGDSSTVVDPTHIFPDDQSDVFYPVELKASNNLGCVDSVTIYLNVKGIIIFYIPNAFTPDGDKYNEVFQPVFDSGFDPYDFHMTIFNRYGEIVFESFDATGGWNGTYGGNGLVENGVYTWQIDFKELHTDKRHLHRGHVTILK